MLSKIKSSVLIVAAGSGLRAGLNVPKQYVKINEKMVLRHAVDSFKDNKNIDNIHIVIAKEHVKFLENDPLFLDIKSKKAKESSKNAKNQYVTYSFGGKTRQESVRLGLEAIKKFNPKNILIHDAARIFVTEKTICGIIDLLKKNDAVIPAKKITDTLKKIKKDKIIDTANRDEIVCVQTPQGFSFEKIYKLHQKYKNKNFTDDSALFEKENLPVKYILTDEDNFKITENSDMEKARAKMEMKKQVRVGMGYDVHQFENGDGVILCGIKIPFNKKLKGHSDADAAWHALVDALLGAVGKGDIGELFPDTDKKWKGANSKIFLLKAGEILKDMDTEINNIDITIVAEKPKLGKFKKEMAKNTAAVLGLKVSQVNVKATTTEKLGFIGREEGIAAQAIVSVCCN